jgi:hypothetical protein
MVFADCELYSQQVQVGRNNKLSGCNCEIRLYQDVITALPTIVATMQRMPAANVGVHAPSDRMGRHRAYCSSAFIISRMCPGPDLDFSQGPSEPSILMQKNCLKYHIVISSAVSGVLCIF